MTGESKIVSFFFACFLFSHLNYNNILKSCVLLQVHKDTKSPFLMSGCKVADGYGDMLVSIVKISCSNFVLT